MIKLFSIVSIAIGLFVNATGIYDHTVPLIEGGSQPLSAYNGKRMLIVTLPVASSAGADSMLYSLDTLAAAHQATHKVIAVPAMEDGFNADQRTTLKQWYRSKLGNYITITDGLYTRKSSGSQQHALFQWLTKASNNQIFDVESEGPGHTFFIMPDGKLHAVLQPQFAIGSRTVYRALTLPQPAGE